VFFEVKHVVFIKGKPYLMMRIPVDLIDRFGCSHIKKALRSETVSSAFR